MIPFRHALFGGCLAVPLAFSGAAMAQPAQAPQVIQVPPGAVVVIMEPSGAVRTSPASMPAAAPEVAPMLRMVAQQEAMMQHMFAEMDSLFPPLPDPTQMIRAMETMGGPGVTTASLGNMHGVCGESVTWSYAGNGTKPVVHVSHYGDACGAGQPGGAQGVVESPAPAPAPRHGPKLLEVRYPAHAIHAG